MTLAASEPSHDLLDDIVQRYLNGETLDSIAAEMQVTSRTLRNWFQRQNRPPPSQVRREQRRTQLSDRIWLEHHYHHLAWTVKQIATGCAVTSDDVNAALDTHNITHRITGPEALIDPDEIRQAIETGESQRSLASRVGVSREVVRQVARNHNLVFTRSIDNRPHVLNDTDWLHQHITIQHHSDDQLAAQLEISSATVARARARHGIAAPKRCVLDRPDTVATLDRLFHDERLPIQEIATRLNVSQSTVNRALQRHKLRGPTPPITRRWLRQQYERRGRTTAAIAAETGYSKSTVQRALRYHRIPARRGDPKGQHWLHKPGWLEQRTTHDRATRQMIAEQLDIPKQLVNSALRRWRPRP